MIFLGELSEKDVVEVEDGGRAEKYFSSWPD